MNGLEIIQRSEIGAYNADSELHHSMCISAAITLSRCWIRINCRGNCLASRKGSTNLSRAVLSNVSFFRTIISAAPKPRIIIVRSVPPRGHLHIREHALRSLSSRVGSSASFPLDFRADRTARLPRFYEERARATRRTAGRPPLVFSQTASGSSTYLAESPSSGTRRRRAATSNPRPLPRAPSSEGGRGEGGLNTSVGRTSRRTNPSTDDDRETKMTVGGNNPPDVHTIWFIVL